MSDDDQACPQCGGVDGDHEDDCDYESQLSREIDSQYRQAYLYAICKVVAVVRPQPRGNILKNKKFQCRYCSDAGLSLFGIFQTNSKKDFLKHIRTCKFKVRTNG